MQELIDALAPWRASITALLVFAVIRYLYRNVILNMLRSLNNKISFTHGEEILNAFEKPINIVLFIGGIYTAINLAPIASLQGAVIIDRILRSTIVLSFFWGCYNLSDTTHGLMLDVLERFGIRSDESVSNIFGTILRILIVLLGFVTIAKEWNYDISGFVASLGIGSLAVAFAAKDSLANVFGSLVIIIDKPFEIGDWISANGVEGTVEKVSFRSTCVRTFPQELVYIPNSLLSNTPITNFTRREKRRIDFSLGLTYNTTYGQMTTVVEKIKNYLYSAPNIAPDNITVTFAEYGDSSLNVRIICYTKTSVYDEYMNTLQELNLSLMKIMEECGVECAFPSTSVYFETPLQNKPDSAEKAK